MKFVLFNLVVGATLAYLILADRWPAAAPPVTGPEIVAAEPGLPVPAVEGPPLMPARPGAALGGQAKAPAAVGREAPVSSLVAPPAETRATSPVGDSAPGGPDETRVAGAVSEREPSGDDLPRRLRALARDMEDRFLAGIR